jgi:5-(carboxyamino)imidazole ribonucleotide mutase
MKEPIVSIIMGSSSDLEIMSDACKILDDFKVSFETRIVSAHRTAEHMQDFAKNASTRGIKIIIAGAGGAAHLPGMVASLTHLPVIGVPVKSSNSVDGWDSILSILQMPNGVPVATVALNGAKNAGLLALRILSITEDEISIKMKYFMEEQKKKVLAADERLKNSGYKEFLENEKGGQ